MTLAGKYSTISAYLHSREGCTLKIRKIPKGDWFEMDDQPYMKIEWWLAGHEQMAYAINLNTGGIDCLNDDADVWEELDVELIDKPDSSIFHRRQKPVDPTG